MGLRAFIAKRLVYSFALVVVILCFNFIIFMLMPGDPSAFLMPVDPSEAMTPELMREREQLLADLWGYGQPYHIQLVKYLKNLLSWQFGKSFFYKTEVTNVMNWRIPYTVFLIGGATVIALVIGVVLGIMAIQRRGGLFDSGSVATSLILNSLPTFWIGLLFLLIFYVTLGWFPNAGAFPREWAGGKGPVPFTTSINFSSNALVGVFSIDAEQALKLIGGFTHHAFLPMLTLILFNFGGWLIFTRATMLVTISEDYVITARAKGLKERAVLFKHALKNASLPIVTSAALSFSYVLGGAMITEAVYTYPGLGRFIFDAIAYQDYSVLMGVFYVLSICVIVANIIADLLYGILDPRIRYG